jgi:chromosome segregation ATPase
MIRVTLIEIIIAIASYLSSNFWLVETRKDIEGGKQNHSENLYQYQEQISNTNSLLEQEKNKWQYRLQELRRQLDDLIRHREDNLKIVLELRLTWQQYENKRKAEKEEQTRLQAKESEMDREHNAAMILQNKIRVFYVSKLNKKKTTKGRRSN